MGGICSQQSENPILANNIPESNGKIKSSYIPKEGEEIKENPYDFKDPKFAELEKELQKYQDKYRMHPH
jgi:hypothetical protein